MSTAHDGTVMMCFPCLDDIPVPGVTLTAEEAPSIGSVNHPDGCAGPCRYVKRKGGCRHGAACPLCHFCFWRRESRHQNEGVISSSSGQVATNSGSQTHEAPPPQTASLGTLGHPFTCSTPCRHVWRIGGCKDGVMCKRCHQCRWTRAAERQSSVSIDAPETPAQTLEALIRLQLSAVNEEGEDAHRETVDHKTEDPQADQTLVQEDSARRPISLADCLSKIPQKSSEPMKVPLPGQSITCRSPEPAKVPSTLLCADFQRRSTVSPNVTKCGACVLPGSEQISIGTVGHPHHCAWPCKYSSKPKGCKDGRNCTRCHLCKWRRADDQRLQASSPCDPDAKLAL